MVTMLMHTQNGKGKTYLHLPNFKPVANVSMQNDKRRLERTGEGKAQSNNTQAGRTHIWKGNTLMTGCLNE